MPRVRALILKAAILILLLCLLITGCAGDAGTIDSSRHIAQQQAITGTLEIARLDTEKNNSAIQARKRSITVYVTETGKKWHRENCRYLNRSRIAKDLETVRDRYTPCSVCNPPR